MNEVARRRAHLAVLLEHEIANFLHVLSCIWL